MSSYMLKPSNSTRAEEITRNHLAKQQPQHQPVQWTGQKDQTVQFRPVALTQPEGNHAEPRQSAPPQKRQSPTYIEEQTHEEYVALKSTPQEQKFTETTVIQKFNPSHIRICVIVTFLLIICLLITVIATTLHSSFEKQTQVHASGVHIAWSNSSENAQKTSQIYSVFYHYSISEFGEWERIPADEKAGIPGVTSEDFSKIISIHSCCKTQKRFMVCSNSNRIDGTTFDIRLVDKENTGIYLEVYSTTKLLTGSQCTLEMELMDSLS